MATDEIVESRVWSGGVEIVSRVNWSQLARVRRSLGLAQELGLPATLRRPSFSPAANLTLLRRSRRARIRAA